MKKKIIFTLFGILLITGMSPLSAIDLSLNVNGGYQTVNDDGLSDIYGNGWIIQATLNLHITSQLALGFFYETGYKRDGKIGIFKEDSTLTIGGFGVAGTYFLGQKAFQPFLKMGAGSFSYKQEIDNPNLDRMVDHSKITIIAGAGCRIRINSILLFNVESQYIPLIVQPFEIKKDLGGFRILIGIHALVNL